MTEEKTEQAVEQEQAAAPQEAAQEETKVNPLERSLELEVSGDEVQALTQKYLRNYAKTASMPGFRKGHVPMSQVEQIYGMRAFDQAVNELVGQAWTKAAQESGLAIAGMPRIEGVPAEEGAKDMKFKAVFEVFPEIEYPDFTKLALKRYTCAVDDAAVQKTLDIMTRQRVTYTEAGADRAAQKDDRVTINFCGTKDGVEFQGGKAEGFQFVIGDGRMLADFDAAVAGMKVGEKKTFGMTFPKDYGPAHLNGAAVEFAVEVTKVEEAHFPVIDDEFAQSLGVEGGVEAMRADIRANLEREVEARLVQKTENEAFETLVEELKFPVPTDTVAQERHALLENFKEQMKRQSGKEPKDFPESVFQETAEKRVRLGLFVEELTKRESLAATDEQIAERAKTIAASYENPEEVEKYLTSDRQRRANLAAQIQQKNICDWLLAKASTTDEAVDFDKVMSGGF